jgi:hypothetical protein
MSSGRIFIDKVTFGDGANQTEVEPQGNGSLEIVLTKRYPPSAVDPVAPAPGAGDQYFNSAAAEWRWFNGAIWIPYGGGAPVMGNSLLSIEVSLPPANGTTSSVATIPAGAKVTKAIVYNPAPFTGGTPTITIGNVTDGPTAFMGTGDSAPAVSDLYIKEQYTTTSATESVDVTVAGGPTGGGPILVAVFYTTPSP